MPAGGRKCWGLATGMGAPAETWGGQSQHALSTRSVALGGQATSAEVAGGPQCGREPHHLHISDAYILAPEQRQREPKASSLHSSSIHLVVQQAPTLTMKKLSPLQETMTAFHCCVLQKILPKECFVEINEWGNHRSSRNYAKHCKKHRFILYFTIPSISFCDQGRHSSTLPVKFHPLSLNRDISFSLP